VTALVAHGAWLGDSDSNVRGPIPGKGRGASDRNCPGLSLKASAGMMVNICLPPESKVVQRGMFDAASACDTASLGNVLSPRI